MTFERLKKEKQNKILNAACEVFGRYGYKKASMKDIAGAAGVSKSVLFKYFTNKQNLYMTVFRLASESIKSADDSARAEDPADMFLLMRRSAKIRLSLFKEFPWIYRFSYTAAFDGDPFVRKLVKKELAAYRRAVTRNGQAKGQGGADDFKGLRADISPAVARQIIFWISQGYLEDKLYREDIAPDGLERGFEEWIDVLETLLKNKKKGVAGKESRVKND
jgi:TetR/AcrR family transcriptional regulator